METCLWPLQSVGKLTIHVHHYQSVLKSEFTFYSARLVFSSDRVGALSGVVGHLWPSENHQLSCKVNRIGVAQIQRFPFSCDCSYDSVTYNLLVNCSHIQKINIKYCALCRVKNQKC